MADLTRRVARLRVPLGFVFAVAVIWLAHPTGRSLAWGGALAVLGESLRVWAAGHLNKSREVTSSGPYRWLAHPLYVGSAVMGVGLAMASGSVVVTLLIALYLGTTITAAVRSEEAFLRGKFGQDYERYRRHGSRAPGEATAPGAAGVAAGNNDASGVGGPSRPFRVSQVMANREYRAIVGLALAVLLLAFKATYNGMFWRTAGTR